MVTCAFALQRIESLKKLRDARQQIQDECYKGSLDEGHDKQINDLNTAISKAKLTAAKVCTPAT